MTRPYFAYGSNMDTVQMKRRCPRAVQAGIGRLAEFKFIINKRGVATIVPTGGSAVYGLLWHITEGDESSLDKCEGVQCGTYRKEEKDVRMISSGAAIRSLIYIASDSTPGSPRKGYMEKILRAARSIALPREYLDELGRFLPR